jgi:hypothetical protein
MNTLRTIQLQLDCIDVQSVLFVNALLMQV